MMNHLFMEMLIAVTCVFRCQHLAYRVLFVRKWVLLRVPRVRMRNLFNKSSESPATSPPIRLDIKFVSNRIGIMIPRSV